MKAKDFDELAADVKEALAEDTNTTFAIVGHTPVSYEIVALFRSFGAEQRLLGVYSAKSPDKPNPLLRPMTQLAEDRPAFAIIAADAAKEEILEQAVPFLTSKTRVILAGYEHFGFRDPVFDEITAPAYVPSLANGYPNTLIHLYQVLANAARLELDGVVAEFGMFKGGTTLLLSRFVEQLGQSWRVIGFDTFDGFPARRSVLDMYSHPGCVFTDEAIVRRCVGDRNIEVVKRDLVDSVRRLEAESIVVAFVDTDNFSSANAVLDVIQDRVVCGGAIVFDHFTGRNRFRYTLGERLAAKRLLQDSRYFNLHDTGVFMKQL